MTDTKLFLPARVPSEGARRLAWWLLRQEQRAPVRLAGAIGVGASLVERLVSGEVEPSVSLASRIARATAGEVTLDDWLARPGGGWGDRVRQRGVVLGPVALGRVAPADLSTASLSTASLSTGA